MIELLSSSGPALVFYLMAAVTVVAAIFVVTARNPMYGAMGLLVSFLGVAVLFVLRHAEFVAIVQVFVYGGGIMVLFLFVIMLINLHRLEETRMFGEGAPLGLGVAFLLVALFVFVFARLRMGEALESPAALVAVEGVVRGNSEAVAWELYRSYLLPFEIVSVFLLVAMVGAVVLGRKA